MKIEVVNRINNKMDSIYCGRGTPLGNPFIMKREKDREEVCDKYEAWFKNLTEREDFKKGLPAYDQLVTIYKRGKESTEGVVYIECFCAPKRCHCNTIKSFLESKVNKTK